MKKVVIILASGFEEIEAVVPIDILRRGGVEVSIAGLESDVVTGAHGITIDTEHVVEEIDPSVYDGIILPGGMDGARNLSDSPYVESLLRVMVSEGKLVAALCASPAIVLSPLGLLENKRVTGYPGIEFMNFEKISYTEEKVTVDGNFITGQGPGAAADFAFAVLGYLEGKEKSGSIAEKALFDTKVY